MSTITNEYRWWHKYAKQNAARAKVTAAIKVGALARPKNCSACGVSGKIQAHHPDYDQPLLVQWLCGSCHYAADDNRGPGKNIPIWKRRAVE